MALTNSDQSDREVHKNPALEVVGWFALCPEKGPLAEHSVFHKQVRSLYAENAIFVAIHPSSFNAIEGTKGTLPISVYEGIESDLQPNDGKMQVDGAEDVKFQSLPYTIETDETEMIAINYVAKGAGSAAAVNGIAQVAGSSSKDTANTGKTRVTSKQDEDVTEAPQPSRVLTTDEEDQVAGITTRVNSVKMLQSRIHLLSKLVASTPPSYLNDPSIPFSENSPDTSHLQQLRNIQALITRLALLTPGSAAGSQSLSQASQAQSNDIALTALLATLGQETQGLSELGKKFVAADMIRSTKNKGKSGYGTSPFGGIDDHDGSTGGFARNSSLMM